MSEVLDKVREKYPDAYANVDDDELALRIGTKFPAYLERDPEFKKEFQTVVGTKAIGLAQKGTTSLIDVLGSPAAGEASGMAREQRATKEKTSAAIQAAYEATALPPGALEGEARQKAGIPFNAPLVPLPRVESSNPSFKAFLAGAMGRVPTEKEAGTVAGLINTGTGFAEFGTTPAGLATASTGAAPSWLQRVVAGAWGVVMAKHAPEAARKFGEATVTGTTQEQVESGLDLAASIFLPATLGKATLAKSEIPLKVAADKVKDSGAPATGAALRQQADILTPENLPKTPQDESGGVKTPVEAEKPAAAGSAEAGKPVQTIRQVLNGMSEFGRHPYQSVARSVKDTLISEGKDLDVPITDEVWQQLGKKLLEFPVEEALASPVPDEKVNLNERITAATFTHPDTGEVSTGKNHIEAASKQGVEAPKMPVQRQTPEYGFEVQDQETSKTRVVTREEGERIARATGTLLNEPKTGVMHSDEVEMVQRKEIQDALHQKTAEVLRDVQQPEKPQEGQREVPTVEPSKEAGAGSGALPQETHGLIDQAMGLVKSRKLTAEDRSAISQGVEAARLGDPSKLQAEVERISKLPPIEKPKVEKGYQAKFNRETAIVGEDILSWIANNMRILSRSGAERKWTKEKFAENKSLWDDAPKKFGTLEKEAPHHNIIYSDKGETPDNVARAAHEAGVLKTGDTQRELWPAVSAASAKRANAEAGAAREMAMGDIKAQQDSDWKEATAEGKGPIQVTTEDVAIGDKLEVAGETLKVAKRDPTGEVQLRGKNKFGDQTLEEGQTIYVDKWEKVPEGEADFGPPAEEAAKVAPEPETVESITAAKEKYGSDAVLAGLEKYNESFGGTPKSEGAKGVQLALFAKALMKGDEKALEAMKQSTPETPKLGSMEKGTGDLLKNLQEAESFSLTGEKGADGDRIASEIVAKEKQAAEAREIAAQQQQEIEMFKPVDPEEEADPIGTLETETPEKLAQDEASDEQTIKDLAKSGYSKERILESSTGKRLGSAAVNKILKESEPPPETRTPNEILGSAKRVKIKVPEGATMLRVTNTKGKSMIRSVTEVNKDNEHQFFKPDVPYKKIEAGTIGKDKKFNPIKGKVEVTDATPKKISEGPGAASPGDFPEDSPLKQLSDTLKAQGQISPKLPIKDRIKQALNVADKVAKGKESVTDALGRSLAVSKALLHSYTHLPDWTNFHDAIGKWIGADQQSAHEVRKFQEAINKSVPQKIRQEAITNWIQANGDEALLRQRADASGARVKKGYEEALTLNDSEKTLARQIQIYFENRLEEGVRAGILKSGVEDYVTQIWKKPNAITQKLIGDLFGSGGLNPSFRYARQRIFDSYFQGEQAGFIPKDKSIGTLLSVYDLAFNRALSARGLIKALNEGFAKDGMPIAMISKPSIREIPPQDPTQPDLFEPPSQTAEAFLLKPNMKPKEAITEDGRPYMPVPHWALKGWRWAMEGKKGEAEAPIFAEGDMVVHPDHYKHLNAVLSHSRLRDNPITSLILKGSSLAKQTKLSLSPFHFTQETIHGGAHMVIPVNLPEIDFTHPVQRGLIDHGLMVSDPHAVQAFGEGMAGGGLVGKIPGLGKAQTWFNDFLFRDYIPKLKMKMAMDALERNRKVYASDIQSGKINDAQLQALTAREANAAFGELNWKLMGRSQEFTDWLRLSVLAPDFLIARGQFVAQAVKPYGREQLMALARMGVTLWVGSRVLNKIFDDDYHFEKPFSLVAGGKEYRLRTVLGDVQHLVTDFRNFWYNRFSPITRTGFEAFTSRDDRGIKRSFWQQVGDFAKWFEPIPVQSLLPGARTDIGTKEQLLTGAGIATTQYNAQRRIFDVADKWMEKNKDPKVKERYDRFKAETHVDSPYTPLRHALMRDDLKDARKEFDKLRQTRTKAQIQEVFHTVRPFTGSHESEQKFKKSLTPEQKKLYEAAVKERRDLYQKLQQMLRSEAAEKVSPSP